MYVLTSRAVRRGTQGTHMFKTLPFGIEIETVGITRDALRSAIQQVTGGVYRGDGVTDSAGRVWNVVYDGSLSGGERSGEIVSPILRYEDLPLLQDIIRAVRRAGARTDSTTGIHIHVDGSRFDAKSLRNLVHFVHKQEALLQHALRVSERRLSRYCQPINQDFMSRLALRHNTMQDIRAAWYGYPEERPSRYHGSRYHGLNLNSLFFRGTIEFRYFNGTLHAGEVKAYVQLVLAMAAKALTAKSACAKRRVFTPRTARYDFRVVLLGLGMIGDEFATARLHLTKHLAGSSAWKREEPTAAAA